MSENKTYVGIVKGATDWTVYVEKINEKDGSAYMRELRHHVRHSPDGFAWGYNGSGPADTARSLLIDALDIDPHPFIYQAFKRERIAAFDKTDGLKMTQREIEEWYRDFCRREEIIDFRTLTESVVVCPVCGKNAARDVLEETFEYIHLARFEGGAGVRTRRSLESCFCDDDPKDGEVHVSNIML